MPGQLKMLFERNVPVLEYYELYTWRFPRPLHKGKPAAIIKASLSPFPFNLLPSQGTGTLRTVKTPLNTAGFDIRATINVPMIQDTAHIGDRWLNKAKKLGRSIRTW
jgi:hypothetical protein